MTAVFNIAKGKYIELWDRVKNGDPSTSRIRVIPLAAAGIPSDATLIDLATVAAVLGVATEQTTLGRKTITAADLPAIPSPDNANDRNERSSPQIQWPASAGAATAKVIYAYDANNGADSALVPLVTMDFATTPDGTTLQIDAGTLPRAS